MEQERRADVVRQIADDTKIRSERTEGLDASADALCGELAFVLEAVKQLLDNRP